MLRHDRLSWYRWEWHDPFQPQYWGACTVSVYAPTHEYPYISILLSIARGKGRVLFRAKSLDELPFGVHVPQEGRERLELALTRAEGILEGLRRELRAIGIVKALPESEAETIVIDAQRRWQESQDKGTGG